MKKLYQGAFLVAFLSLLEVSFGIDEAGGKVALVLLFVSSFLAPIGILCAAVNEMIEAMERDHEWY